ncbi:transcriptional regulator, GntR family [Dethiosulfatibacter aminovorans DSM 17477]|uniref:Transcriptional regulator, GntR family n=1 Tax=Dethiosulfatibacter aminovorans DSM 17477 TaxID=1121476 RepID=A0A1M6GEG9_9FIRM|nr:FadR/GntR family transcriptional regulator [Dethiosulfatibacter aminovorans]SHJ08319.1 transcriptional regulator, GntR family [Dethiosulfatibacter aminovorans DSM 17477]
MFKQVKSKKVYQHVVEQIQVMVMNGELKNGDKLPTERDLAEQLGVSRTSIREALRSLEMVGLVESRQGEGNFIGGNIRSNFFEPLSVMFMLNQGDPRDILELRMVIEVEAAALAAKRVKNEGREEDVKELNAIMQKLREATSEEESSSADLQLHYKISEITGNYLIMMLLNTISTLMETFIESARGMILVDYTSREKLLNEHQNLVDSISEGDSRKAVKFMRAHLETVNKTMEERQK